MPITTVGTDIGDVSGATIEGGKAYVFKGIPYASPPVGNLRWRAPQPVAAWTGTRAAMEFGPRSIQHERPSTSISYFGPETESEDCLYLNIWTPTLDRGAKRPVMMWLHGGSFAVGSSSLPIFDGRGLARKGVVVVTVNYRLGALGFMAHPELTRESETGASGNWGLLDQIEALRWLGRNIEAFGGDPNCVTIFGQSAGSSSVNCLMASPSTRGLFHRAIGESGGSVAPLGKPGGGSLTPLATAEQQGRKTARELGFGSLQELRAAPARDIQLSWPRDRAGRPWIIVDGEVVPDSICDVFEAAKQHDIPLLTGSNADEGSSRAPAVSAARWKEALSQTYGEDGSRIFEAYGGGVDFADESRRQGGHATFSWSNWTWARLHARSARSNVYAYYFRREPPLPFDRPYAENKAEGFGAFHTGEIPYAFGNLAARPWAWTDYDHHLAETLSSYWVNFATSGDPNGKSLPTWPAFEANGDSLQIIGDAVGPSTHPEIELMRHWDHWMGRVRERGGFRDEAGE
jgi:para-nitrobenzyl esterase